MDSSKRKIIKSFVETEILGKKTDFFNGELFNACYHGNLSKIKKILGAIAGPNCSESKAVIERTLTINAKKKDDGTSSLYIACNNGHLEVVRLLVYLQADIEIQTLDGSTPLLISCLKGHTDIVRHLLDSNANINTPRYSGATPLYVACQGTKL